jgi:AraC-like DNA-binding protein
MEKFHDNCIIHEITPLSDKDCFYIADRHKTEFTYPIHKHSEFELNFCSNATGVRRIVGDSAEVIDDYDLVLITGKDLEHVWEQHECHSKDIREITIQFSADLFFNNFINKNQFDSIRIMLERAQVGLCFPMPAIMRVYSLLDTLAFEKKGFYAVIQFLSILYELSLFKDESRPLSSSSFAKMDIHSDSRRVQKVKDYINEHYQEEIRLNQLADLAGMTSVSFSRFFKLRTGKNLSEYIIDIRLGFAARLLVDSTMSVAEICYECGFNNLSNFNRIFKKNKECSPKEFREEYRKKKKLI